MYNKKNTLSCKLTTPALRERKATVIASLKEAVTEKHPVPGGFRYRFDGADKILDVLLDFIKTERQCCDFFTFTLQAGNTSLPVWLELTGPKGAKEFITSEVGL